MKRLLAVATTLASAPDADAQNYPAPKEGAWIGTGDQYHLDGSREVQPGSR
ncbi:MAG: hypothetical protein WA683_12180 [Pseudolabrys sp.]